MAVFQLEIVTPTGILYDGAVERLRAPGSEGGFGVLANHQPMLVSLRVGAFLFVEENGEAREAATSGGFLEVRSNRVTVLAETAELSDQIDVDRARASRGRALERLSQKRDLDIDFLRATAACSRARNRLCVAGMEGN